MNHTNSQRPLGRPHSLTLGAPDSAGSTIPTDWNRENLKFRIRYQIEYYFSPGNLVCDHYLLSQMDPDHFVPLTTIAGFNKIKTMSQDLGLIVEALRGSHVVFVDEARQLIRPNINVERKTLLLRQVPEHFTSQNVTTLFERGEGDYAVIDVQPNGRGVWLVTFSNEFEARTMMERVQGRQPESQALDISLKPKSLLEGLSQARLLDTNISQYPMYYHPLGVGNHAFPAPSLPSFYVPPPPGTPGAPVYPAPYPPSSNNSAPMVPPHTGYPASLPPGSYYGPAYFPGPTYFPSPNTTPYGSPQGHMNRIRGNHRGKGNRRSRYEQRGGGSKPANPQQGSPRGLHPKGGGSTQGSTSHKPSGSGAIVSGHHRNHKASPHRSPSRDPNPIVTNRPQPKASPSGPSHLGMGTLSTPTVGGSPRSPSQLSSEAGSLILDVGGCDVAQSLKELSLTKTTDTTISAESDSSSATRKSSKDTYTEASKQPRVSESTSSHKSLSNTQTSGQGAGSNRASRNISSGSSRGSNHGQVDPENAPGVTAPKHTPASQNSGSQDPKGRSSAEGSTRRANQRKKGPSGGKNSATTSSPASKTASAPSLGQTNFPPLPGLSGQSPSTLSESVGDTQINEENTPSGVSIPKAQSVPAPGSTISFQRDILLSAAKSHAKRETLADIVKKDAGPLSPPATPPGEQQPLTPPNMRPSRPTKTDHTPQGDAWLKTGSLSPSPAFQPTSVAKANVATQAANDLHRSNLGIGTGDGMLGSANPRDTMLSHNQNYVATDHNLSSHTPLGSTTPISPSARSTSAVA
ncbi:La- protein 4, partial [Dispira simplex]